MAIYGYARVGKMRIGAFRLGYRQPTPMITINGTNRTATVRVAGLTVRDYLYGQPNIATIRVRGFTPTRGHEVKIGLGSLQPSCLLFAGNIQRLAQVAEGGLAANVAWDLTCVSYEWLLNRRKVNAKFTNVSASTIVGSLMDDFTAGFTYHIEPGLDVLDEITFTNEDVTDALDRVAKRVGAAWYVDYGRKLRFFVTSEGSVHSITTGTEVFKPAGITADSDLSQVRTRVFFEGGGSVTPCGVAVGAVLLPVDDLSWYVSFGGLVQVAQQRAAYTGIRAGGTGSLVGSVLGSPASAPVAGLRTGAGITAGAHRYKYSFGTAGGETLCGPASNSITTGGTQAAPSGALVATNTNVAYGTSGAGLDLSAGYQYGYTFYDPIGGGETTLMPSNSTITANAGTITGMVQVSSADAAPAGLVRRFYRTDGGGVTFKLLPGTQYEGFEVLSTFFGTSYYFESYTDAQLGAAAPGANTLAISQATLTSIAVSPSGSVTKRKIYRTEAGGTTYKLLATINDNTTTTYTDSTADGSLGAVEPASDSAGLTASDGTVLAGATSIPLATTTEFHSSGGYARIASQVVTYTGKSASALTGVPASGDGALTATVNYGAEALTVPVLTGIPASGDGAIQYAVKQGESVNVLAQADDAAAQAAMAGAVGGDGIVEDHLLDQRFSLVEAQNRAEARLEEVKDPLVSVNYSTRDQATRTGLDVTLAIGAPTNITGTFRIQSVTTTLTGTEDRNGLYPVRQVQASSRRLTFEGLLRLVKGAA